MTRISDALKTFAASINAEPAPGDKIVDTLNSIVVRLGGEGTAYTTEQAILNLAALGDKINKLLLIEKEITEPGEYLPSEEEPAADGYSKVTVTI